MSGLEEDDLTRILTEPRNALVKQYERFFEMEGVKLDFSPDALRAVASVAMKKGTGARALRSILEDLMLDVMYDLPSEENVSHCKITRDVVEGRTEPELVRRTLEPVSKSA